MSKTYELMCKVLKENCEIVNFEQLSKKMVELGHEDLITTQGAVEMAFGWIAQFRPVVFPVWDVNHQ